MWKGSLAYPWPLARPCLGLANDQRQRCSSISHPDLLCIYADRSPRDMRRMTFLKRWKIRLLIFFAVVGLGLSPPTGQRCRRHLTYSAAGPSSDTCWTMIPITVADRGAGDRRLHGRGHRQGPERSDSRGIRVPHTFLMMIGWSSSTRQRGHGIGWHRRQPGTIRFNSTTRSRFAPSLVDRVKGQYKTVEKVFLAASFFFPPHRRRFLAKSPGWSARSHHCPAAQGDVSTAGLPVW